MNFEFKSTFRTQNSLREIPFSFWILALNIIGAAIVAYLYFENYFIPATIGSARYGHYYIPALKTAMYFHFLTSLCALGHLFIHAIVTRTAYSGSNAFVFKLFHTIRQSSVIIILLIHLGRFMPRRGYTLSHQPDYPAQSSTKPNSSF